MAKGPESAGQPLAHSVVTPRWDFGPCAERCQSCIVNDVDPQRIIVPVNPSSKMAERGVPAAVAAARLFGCGIELLQCVEDPHEVSRLQREVEPIRCSIRVAAPDVPVRSSTIVEPHAPLGIIAATQPAHLPVIATRATILGFHHYVGSAAEKVVAGTGRPALLVGPAADAEYALEVDSVLVPVDPESPSLGILDLAHHWAAQLGVPMTVISVIGTAHDYSATRDLLEKGISDATLEARPPQVRVIRAADPALVIARLGVKALIVMNSHGRTGLRRMVMGSVTTEVVRWAKRAVLVVLIEAVSSEVVGIAAASAPVASS